MNYHLIPIGNDCWGILLTHIEGYLYTSKKLIAATSKARKLAQRDRVILYIHSQTGRITEREDYRGVEE